MVGSRVKQTCRAGKDQAAEVVQDHESGAREERQLVPRLDDGERRRESAVNQKADFSTVYDGGAVFGKPQERRFGLIAESHGSGRDGKVGVKVKRVVRTYPFGQ